MKEKKRDNRARDRVPPQEWSLNRGSFQTPGNRLTRESGGSFRIFVGQPNWEEKEIKPTDYMPPKKTASRKLSQMLASATSKWGLNREQRAALLRVRTRPECPEGNRRELA